MRNIVKKLIVLLPLLGILSGCKMSRSDFINFYNSKSDSSINYVLSHFNQGNVSKGLERWSIDLGDLEKIKELKNNKEVGWEDYGFNYSVSYSINEKSVPQPSLENVNYQLDYENQYINYSSYEEDPEYIEYRIKDESFIDSEYTSVCELYKNYSENSGSQFYNCEDVLIKSTSKSESVYYRCDKLYNDDVEDKPSVGLIKITSKSKSTNEDTWTYTYNSTEKTTTKVQNSKSKSLNLALYEYLNSTNQINTFIDISFEESHTITTTVYQDDSEGLLTDISLGYTREISTYDVEDKNKTSFEITKSTIQDAYNYNYEIGDYEQLYERELEDEVYTSTLEVISSDFNSILDSYDAQIQNFENRISETEIVNTLSNFLRKTLLTEEQLNDEDSYFKKTLFNYSFLNSKLGLIIKFDISSGLPEKYIKDSEDGTREEIYFNLGYFEDLPVYNSSEVS